MIWGLIILYVFTLIGIGVVAAKHGEDKNEKYDFWGHLISLLIGYLLIWWALGWRFI